MSIWQRVKKYVNSVTNNDTETAAELGLAHVVEVWPSQPLANQKLEVRYAGELAGDSRQVFMHYGIQTDEENEWKYINDIRMQKRSDGIYTAVFQVPSSPGKLSMCFHNEYDEWDNNQGKNWIYPLQ